MTSRRVVLHLGQRVGQWVACKRACLCFVKTAQWLRKAGTAGGACWIRDDAKAQVEALGLHGMPSPWSTRTPIRADRLGRRDSQDLSKPHVPEDDRFVPKVPAVHNASPKTPMAGVFGEISAGVDLHVGIEGFSLPPVAPAKTWHGMAGAGCKASILRNGNVHSIIDWTHAHAQDFCVFEPAVDWPCAVPMQMQMQMQVPE
ncbi:hypothetical protein GGP41_006056 [Bipolaris sorokiniana]|uniref:Uncharacterized protein n=1 Tax=Cochliobolus sativus TaxID=45130 RepID=A0A8H5ZI16_COCSA|nr:hypothetical protein GGP41_006056 [Bipolaris sorokiniana]